MNMRKRDANTLMRVKDLVKQLQKEDQEAVILIQRDPEGNGIHDLFQIVETKTDSLAFGGPSITLVAASPYIDEDDYGN